MKYLKSLSFLIGTLALLLIPEPSFGKQTWLSCKNKLSAGELSKSNHSFIINLDYTKERFEITEEGNEIYQGKATFFKSAIKFEYIIKIATIKIERVWEISRANLVYSSTAKIIDGLGGPTLYTGSCKVIPAPSSKNNLI